MSRESESFVGVMILYKPTKIIFSREFGVFCLIVPYHVSIEEADEKYRSTVWVEHKSKMAQFEGTENLNNGRKTFCFVFSGHCVAQQLKNYYYYFFLWLKSRFIFYELKIPQGNVEWKKTSFLQIDHLKKKGWQKLKRKIS